MSAAPVSPPAFNDAKPESFGFGGMGDKAFAPVNLVATTNQDLQNVDTDTVISGVQLAAGMSVLFAAQTTAADRGVYAIISQGVGDRIAGYHTTPGLVIEVLQGDNNDKGRWQLTSVSPQTWAKVQSGATPSQAGYDESSPTSVSNPAPNFDNVAPGNISTNAPSFDNTSPVSVSSPAPSFDSTPPTHIVIAGETSPVAGVTIPAPATLVAHTFPLVAGTNYRVTVGNRAAPVNIPLPDPGSANQQIEIVDTSGQAVAFPITVNGGTRDIEATGVKTFVINRNQAVLTLFYTGTYWKQI